MKTRALTFLPVVCLLALAAWLVRPNNAPDLSSQNAFSPIAHGAGPNSAEAIDVPGKYRDTVKKGLEYLVKNQHKDGHWEGDDGKHPVAMTGLVGLALLMEQDNPTAKRQRSQPRSEILGQHSQGRGLADGPGSAGRDGLIFSGHPSETARYMQGHGLATLFLAGACKNEKDRARRKKLTDVLTRAVKYIVKAQSSQGGWYHTSKVEGHDFDEVSATAIQVQALQAAENAGVPVPHEAIYDAQEYLKMAIEKYEKGAGPGQNRGRPADTAAALACRFTLSNASRSRFDKANDELCKKWFKYCQTEIPVGPDMKFGRDELTLYYYAQALFNLGGDAWSGYRRALFDQLQSSQNKDGSWPAGNGISVGPVYSTAVCCTILQLGKRSHPLMRPRPYTSIVE